MTTTRKKPKRKKMYRFHLSVGASVPKCITCRWLDALKRNNFFFRLNTTEHSNDNYANVLG